MTSAACNRRPMHTAGCHLAMLLAIALGAHAADGPGITGLRCEYLVDPIGLHDSAPRLSWIVESSRRGDAQTAYEILVASTPELLARDQGDLWSSGQVASAENAHIAYAGKPLASRQACTWKVRIRDRDGRLSAWSVPARWEMGLLRQDEWSARWIEGIPPADPQVAASSLAGAAWIWTADEASAPPPGLRCFRRTFQLPAAPPGARLVIAVDDAYQVWINGREAASLAVKDGWRHARVYEVAAHLQAGLNRIAIAATNDGGPAGLCAKLTIELPDQQRLVIVTDQSWKDSGPVPGWDGAGFDNVAWPAAAVVAPFGGGVWGDPGSRSSAVPILRTTMRLDKPVASARLYATALGLYELRLNGQRVGDHALAPEWTDYRKRVRYQVYDVAALLRPGENAMVALLANGWYSGRIGNGGNRHYGTVPALLAQLEVTYADGSRGRWISDGTWKVHASPTTSSDLMLGEDHDARLEIAGWDQPGLDTATWPVANVRAAAERPLEGQMSEPVRQLGELPARSLSEPLPGRWVYDLGQNMVGVVRLHVSAPAGTSLTLRHAEMLNPDGTLYTDNLRTAAAVDRYICRGGGETWQPRFTFHGFRYVELSGLPTRPGLEAVTGIVLGSDTPQTGHFSCSDPRINQLQSNIRWGQRGNFLSVPTDCPQRDERLGWMGDAQIFMRTATCNADVAAFFSKWLVDVADAQQADGAFSDVSPASISGSGVPGWADAGVICPWIMHEVYGDTRILERQLPSMLRWIAWMRERSTGLIRESHRGSDYGDWLAQNADTPKDLIGTAYFAHSTALVAKSCRALGRHAEAERHERLFADIKAAFLERYVRPDGRIHGDTQTAYALALRFDLLDPQRQALAARHLAVDVAARDHHLTTGFLGVSHLLPALSQAGHDDTAFALLLQDGFPSWLFSVRHGATTIWERWDGWTPGRGFQDPGMNSFNHYALGSCGEWMYGSLAGLGMDPSQPAFRRVLIQPRVGGGITSSSASMRTMRGRLTAAWSVGDGRFELDCDIPVGSAATVILPTREASDIREGGHPIVGRPEFTSEHGASGSVRVHIASGSYAFSCTFAP